MGSPGLLRRGDHGADVTLLQDRLQALGTALADERVHGTFGLWTEAAVYLLQRSAGLGADGVVGPQTQAALADPPAAFLRQAVAPLVLVPGVPYASQRDNVHQPLSSCNVTALAMALRAAGVAPRGAGQLEDELFELLRSPAADAYYRAGNPDLHSRGVPANEVHDNLVWAAGSYGVPASFSGHRSLADLTAEVTAGRPALLSGVFVGTGHIVLLIGVTASGDFICHDPYGDWNSGYRDRDGEARIYAQERMWAVLKDLGAADKWGLFLRA